MIYNYHTGNKYFYHMSDVVSIIMIILSIPFFFPVYKQKAKNEKMITKSFVLELVVMAISLLILIYYCFLLSQNFETPFIA